MQEMTVALRKMIQEISGGVQILASSSNELMATSSEMTSGSREASDKAHSVSAAAEEMSSNVTSVAAGMEQTTTNLAHVSAATEQMTATIGEIAQNSEKARRITDEATRQAGRITEQMNQLGVAAREIGKVTETITEISKRRAPVQPGKDLRWLRQKSRRWRNRQTARPGTSRDASQGCNRRRQPALPKSPRFRRSLAK
jgi:methyl-accepting chemotaxis protein